MSSSPTKHTVYLGMGSNSYRKTNLRFGLDAIREVVSDMEISPVVLSEAVGVQADMFFNLVVRGFCTITVEELSNRIKQIESMTGRTKSSSRVSLDIDILMYGTSEGAEAGLGLTNPDLLNAPHVLYPLALMSPHETHPVIPDTCQNAWHSHPCTTSLWPVQFDWNGRELTPSSLLPNRAELPASITARPTHYICGQAIYT